MDQANTSTVTDDQELAKVLESMNQQAGSTPAVPATDDTVAEPVTTTDGLAFEETAPAVDGATQEAAADQVVEPVVEPVTEPTVSAVADPTPAPSPELDSLKKDALEELRPLVDKLNLPAEEKFDTLLLLIRSTDDKSLLSAAHEAAKSISDETKRAQALLDVIKEIDYFSGHGAQPQ